MRRFQVARPLNANKRIAVEVEGQSALPKRDTDEGMSGGERGIIGGTKTGDRGRAEGDIYTPGDFGVGVEVWISGRRFRIVDADLITRQWYKRTLGKTLKEAEDYPDDGYGAQRAKVSMPNKR